eukprot:TRINITY_DN28935_c1_g3_i2.p1 TRINITY_DN28935_c1_g3~~TRINITY_DN28935_c1_g3_i2.p1  ORF type:complete len:141 (-),score=18.18 TRINITY_DN28935_c1_g3_i2:279-701(-)
MWRAGRFVASSESTTYGNIAKKKENQEYVRAVSRADGDLVGTTSTVHLTSQPREVQQCQNAPEEPVGLDMDVWLWAVGGKVAMVVGRSVGLAGGKWVCGVEVAILVVLDVLGCSKRVSWCGVEVGWQVVVAIVVGVVACG